MTLDDRAGKLLGSLRLDALRGEARKALTAEFEAVRAEALEEAARIAMETPCSHTWRAMIARNIRMRTHVAKSNE